MRARAAFVLVVALTRYVSLGSIVAAISFPAFFFLTAPPVRTNYAVVTGELATVPLALGLPLYALVFSVLNAAVLAIRIPVENTALAGSASCKLP